jgi:hypothetical protein
MLAEQPTFCNKPLAIVERERDNGELSRGTADVHTYNTHHLLALLPSGSVKTGQKAGTRREQAREARK